MSPTRTYYGVRVITGTTSSLREANLANAMRALHADPGLTRAALTARLGISRNTASQLVAKLSAARLIVEGPAEANGRQGRPTAHLAFGPRSPATVVAEVGPGLARVATVELGRQAKDVALVDLQTDALAAARDLARALASRCRAIGDRLLGVGVALYGLASPQGQVVVAPNMGWGGLPLKDVLKEELPADADVAIYNDASSAALYECLYGAGRGVSETLYLYSAIGVGGGITKDGHLVRGHHGFAGEVGHMLVNPMGERCRCGRVGCWETEVDENSLLRRYASLIGGPGYVPVSEVFERARNGEQAAAQALDETTRWAGEGVGSLLNILDSDRVILAGFFADLLQARRETLMAVVSSRTLIPTKDLHVRISASQHGSDAPLLGCAEQIFQRLLDEQVALYVADS